jgi:hypothetical protein
MKRVIASCTLLILSVPAFAVCSQGRPTIKQEWRSSVLVAIATPISSYRLQEDRTDPEGVTATNYKVKLENVMHGNRIGAITIRSENTSSRFTMDVGKRYLLFIRSARGVYYVDSCGNSSEL